MTAVLIIAGFYAALGVAAVHMWALIFWDHGDREAFIARLERMLAWALVAIFIVWLFQ